MHLFVNSIRKTRNINMIAPPGFPISQEVGRSEAEVNSFWLQPFLEKGWFRTGVTGFPLIVPERGLDSLDKPKTSIPSQPFFFTCFFPRGFLKKPVGSRKKGLATGGLVRIIGLLRLFRKRFFQAHTEKGFNPYPYNTLDLSRSQVRQSP